MLKPGRIEALQPHRQGVGLQRMQARLRYLSKFVKIFFSWFSRCFWLPYSFSVLKRRQVIQAMRGSLRWKVSLESSTKVFFVFGKESENGHIRENTGSFILWYIFYARESIICFFNIAVNIIMGLNTKHLFSVKLGPFPLENPLYKIPT